MTANPYSTDAVNRVMLTEVDDKMCLNMVGKVTRFPTVGCVPLCECFGVQWYVDGKGFDSLRQDDFIPGWLVPEQEHCDDLDPLITLQATKKNCCICFQVGAFYATEGCED